MKSLNKKRIFVVVGILLLIYGALYLVACAPAPKKRTFARQDCLDCHKEFGDKYLKMKSVHAVVKEKKCEECHLRHGIVPKLILKNRGNEICYTCNEK